jgi:hypothetical protein
MSIGSGSAPPRCGRNSAPATRTCSNAPRVGMSARQLSGSSQARRGYRGSPRAEPDAPGPLPCAPASWPVRSCEGARADPAQGSEHTDATPRRRRQARRRTAWPGRRLRPEVARQKRQRRYAEDPKRIRPRAPAADRPFVRTHSQTQHAGRQPYGAWVVPDDLAVHPLPPRPGHAVRCSRSSRPGQVEQHHDPLGLQDPVGQQPVSGAEGHRPPSISKAAPAKDHAGLGGIHPKDRDDATDRPDQQGRCAATPPVDPLGDQDPVGGNRPGSGIEQLLVLCAGEWRVWRGLGRLLGAE